jgi:hypothetical protein
MGTQMHVTGRMLRQRIAGRPLRALALLVGLSSILVTSPVLAADILTIELSSNGAALEWRFPGVLQYAAQLTNSWADFPRAVNSASLTVTNTCMFYRVRKPLFTVVDTAQTKGSRDIPGMSPAAAQRKRRCTIAMSGAIRPMARTPS